jgi:phage terminase large subunit GpA-like protein
MDHLAVITITLLCAAGLALVLERAWRARLWRRQEGRAAEQLDAVRTASEALTAQLQAEKTRRQQLESLVLELSSSLQQKDTTAAERRLLNDIYHEYGTETHALIFAEQHGTG